MKFHIWEVTCITAQNKCHMWNSTWGRENMRIHVWKVTCEISHVTFRMKNFTWEIPHATFLMWNITCDMWLFPYDFPYVKYRIWNFICDFQKCDMYSNMHKREVTCEMSHEKSLTQRFICEISNVESHSRNITCDFYHHKKFTRETHDQGTCASDTYSIFIEPTNTWVPSGYSECMWLETKKALKMCFTCERKTCVFLTLKVKQMCWFCKGCVILDTDQANTIFRMNKEFVSECYSMQILRYKLTH